MWRPCLLAMIVILAGCKGGFSERAAAQRHGVFRYALEKPVVTFDPGRVQDPEGIEMLGNVYEGLVSYSEANKIVPQLAESFAPSADGKVWTFHLRPDAKFHNGAPVTAGDFKWTFERNLRPEFASPVALNYLGDIEGAEAVAKGTGTLTGARVVDDHTLEITLVEPRPYFLGKLTYPCAFALHRAEAGLTEMRTAAQMVGTGPFRIGQIVPDQLVTFTANPDYYLGSPHIEGIERPIVKDPLTRMNLYKQGDLDLVGVLRADLESVQNDPVTKAQLHLVVRPVVYYIGFNQKQYPPFQKLAVRRAVAMAIDRDTLARDILNNRPVARGLIARGVEGYRSQYQGIAYDPAAARALLVEAGYPGGKGLPPLEMFYRESAPDSRVIVEAIHGNLTRNLNMPIRLRALEASAFFEKRNQGQMPSFFLSWGADYLDPQNFTTFLFRSDSPMNFEGYHNAEFDRIARLADATVATGRRIPLYQQAEDILIQDAARVPLFFGLDASLVNPRVHGLRPNLMGNLPHLKVTVDK